MKTDGAHSRIRTCAWERIPLGSVILEWPTMHNAFVPELMAYPVITEGLRSALHAKYRFLEGRRVTIADPSLGLDEGRVSKAAMDARRLLSGRAEASSLKQRLRTAFLGRPDLREGLEEAMRYGSGPYCLRKSWSRSVAAIVRDKGGFGDELWGPAGASLGETLGGLLAGELPPLPGPSSSTVDLAIDVSRSMEASGKADLAWAVLGDLVAALSRSLGTSSWRLWLLAGKAFPVDLARLDPANLPPLAGLVAASGLDQDRTAFAPFLNRILYEEPARDGISVSS